MSHIPLLGSTVLGWTESWSSASPVALTRGFGEAFGEVLAAPGMLGDLGDLGRRLTPRVLVFQL